VLKIYFQNLSNSKKQLTLKEILFMKQKKTISKPNFGLGWVPDLPDQRDFTYTAPQAVFKTLPASTDLRKLCPPVYNQECLGSCTANAIAGAIQFEQIRQSKKTAFMPSRLFIYYNERVIEKTVNSDSGAQIRDGIKTVVKQGVCPEKEWPYTIGTCKVIGNDPSGEPIYDTGAKFKQKPTKACYTDAVKYQVLQYQSINNVLAQMKGCLAEGFPFVFGFTVYESFYNIGKNGMMPLPAHNEQIAGGHAVMAVGYNDAKQVFIIRNSWGNSWGVKGYFYMPYSFITSSNCNDLWTIRIVEL
jgi:C1A family cysteine protease